MTERLLERGDTEAGTVRKLDARAFAELGSIDAVINNAGYGLMEPAEEFSDEQVEHVLDTNLLGSIQVTRSAIPYLREQGWFCRRTWAGDRVDHGYGAKHDDQ